MTGHGGICPKLCSFGETALADEKTREGKKGGRVHVMS